MAVQFTSEMINAAIATEKQTGVPASITLGQLVLESGYSSPSNLSTLAKEYNNYFGVKAIGGWTGGTTPYMTNSKGQDGAVYRAYNSVTEGFTDHAKILQAERYQKYFREAKSIEDYAWGLQKGGYATAPNYATSLISVIKSNNLTQYDGKDVSVDMTGLNFVFGDTFDSITGSSTTEQVTDVNAADLNMVDSILSTVIVFAVLFAILVVAVVSFMKAFDLKVPSLPDVGDLVKGGGSGE